MGSFLLAFVTHPLNTLVAIAFGAFCHVTLKTLLLKIKARLQKDVTSIAPKV